MRFSAREMKIEVMRPIVLAVSSTQSAAFQEPAAVTTAAVIGGPKKMPHWVICTTSPCVAPTSEGERAYFAAPESAAAGIGPQTTL